jgi:hypothetical protein
MSASSFTLEDCKGTFQHTGIRQCVFIGILNVCEKAVCAVKYIYGLMIRLRECFSGALAAERRFPNHPPS